MRLAALRERGRQRFIWQADAGARFTFVSDTLADVVGIANAAIVGQSWEEIAGRFVEDADGCVARLFAGRETWSGRTVLWRIEGTRHAVPVDLAGIPAVGAEREILGFRGFGVCRTEALQEIGIPPSASSERDDSPPSSAGATPLMPDALGTEEGAPGSVQDDAAVKPVDEGASAPSARSPPPAESAMPVVMSAPTSELFVGTLRARVGARLGRPRPVPFRACAPGARAAPTLSQSSPERAEERPEGAGTAKEAMGRLSTAERQAFRDIARALSTRSDAARPPDEQRPPLQRPAKPAEAAPPRGDAAAQLREVSSILDTVSDGIIVIDGSARILSLNRSAEALFGFEQQEVLGDRLTRLFAPESQAAALDYVVSLRAGGVAGLLNDGRALMGRVRQGGVFPLAITIGRVGEESEDRFCVVLRDITAQQVTERELAEAHALVLDAAERRSDFLAKISHEIRTPLNTVIGFAEIIAEERFGPVGNERYLDYIRDIRHAGGQVIRMVDGLLDLARIESGRMPLSFTGVGLNAVASGVVSGMQAQALRGRIVLRTSFGPELPAVVADADAIRQIAENVLANAIAYTQPGGQVIVSTALTDRGEVAFRVRDTGVGMSRDEIEAALEPLRRMSSRREGGLGLGLPLTKALVEANRGELLITSAPQRGTLVEVLFPAKRTLPQ